MSSTIDKVTTNKLNDYFHTTKLNKCNKLTNRQQRKICEDVDCSSIQLVEYLLFNVVTKNEESEKH